MNWIDFPLLNALNAHFLLQILTILFWTNFKSNCILAHFTEIDNRNDYFKWRDRIFFKLKCRMVLWLHGTLWEIVFRVQGSGSCPKGLQQKTLADTVTDPKKCLIMSYYTAVDTNKQSCQQFSWGDSWWYYVEIASKCINWNIPARNT